MTSDLDQQILARIDRTAMHPTSTHATLQLADALRAVLDLDHFSGTTQWQRGWNEALNAVRNAIAEELDVTDRAEREAAVKLNEAARTALRDAGVSQAAWARHHGYADGRWFGDACGCPDDRCIGYHHDEQDECQCIRVLLADLKEHATPPGRVGGVL